MTYPCSATALDENPTTAPLDVGDVVTGHVWLGAGMGRPRAAPERECIVDQVWYNAFMRQWIAVGRFRTKAGHWSKHQRIIQRPWGNVTQHEPTEIERILAENNWLREQLGLQNRERELA